MQSGADKLLETMSDQENGYDAEEAIFDRHTGEHGQAAPSRSNHTTTSDEDTIRQHQNRHKLTIDITSAPSPARPKGSSRNDHAPQRSPSINSAAASSPRMLYPDNPLRSPGVVPPISPRHASRAPS